MLFNTAAFVVFLTVTLGVYWGLPGTRARHGALLLAGLFFYGFWDYRFLPLIGYVTFVAFVTAKLLERTTEPQRKRALLALGCVLQLGQLAVFKYTNFVLSSFGEVAAALALDVRAPTFDVILPVGVSFYTFQALGYMIDVHRGHLKPARGLLQVALYVSFFPHLVAGPIVRGREFFPQLDRPPRLSRRDLIVGLKLVVIGLIYKGVFADRVGPLIDPVFASPEAYDRASRLWAILGFYSQIYFDFAGYSTMAIGMSRWFGIRLSRNFDYPYRASNITEFWRRWHISLSTWLRDYLYIPLGGSRGGRWLLARNLFLTMLLGGLWHGASYNFVLWGALHGAALVVHKRFSERFAAPQAAWQQHVRGLAGWALTQSLVLLLWIPFRATDLAACVPLLQAIAGDGDFGDKRMQGSFLLLGLPLLLDHALLGETRLAKVSLPRRAWIAALVLGLALAWTLPFLRLDVQNFIYFQF